MGKVTGKKRMFHRWWTGRFVPVGKMPSVPGGCNRRHNKTPTDLEFLLELKEAAGNHKTGPRFRARHFVGGIFPWG
jgi:hypothetical protein